MKGNLTAIEGPLNGKNYSIPKHGELTLGRVSDNDIALMDPSISRRHCAFTMAGGRFVVQDKGSSNGTYVNDERKQAHALQAGDRVRVGPLLFLFDIEEESVEFAETNTSPAPAATGATAETTPTMDLPMQGLVGNPGPEAQHPEVPATLVLSTEDLGGPRKDAGPNPETAPTMLVSMQDIIGKAKSPAKPPASTKGSGPASQDTPRKPD